MGWAAGWVGRRRAKGKKVRGRVWGGGGGGVGGGVKGGGGGGGGVGGGRGGGGGGKRMPGIKSEPIKIGIVRLERNIFYTKTERKRGRKTL